MKVGIVGCAHMHVHSYTLCLKTLGVEIVGIYERDKEQMLQFSEKYGITPYEQLDDLLQTDMDTVLICSENVLHCEYTVSAAAYKKHVIVEKPMALTVEDAEKMISDCYAADVKLMVAHPVRFSQPMQTLKQSIEEGVCGRLIAINTTNHGKSPGGWFVEKKLSGGGAIIDHTIHMADLVNWFFAPQIESVFAIGENLYGESDVEDTGLLHVTFTDGTFMSLDTSWNRPKRYPVWGDASLTLVTDRGWIHADGFGKKALLYNQKANPSFKYYEEDMDMAMIKSFKEAIDHNLPSPVSGEDGLFTVKMARMAYQSIEKGTKVIN